MVTALRAKRQAITSKEEPITPSKALEYLGTIEKNRGVTQAKVIQYTKAMRDGEWDETLGDPIRFDADGHLLDGQHRLWAVVEFDKPVKFTVRRGLAKKSFLAMDQGRVRSLSDALHIQEESYCVALAGAIRVLWAYNRTGVFTRHTMPAYRGSTPQLLALLDEHPRLRDHMREAGLVRSDVGGGHSPWSVMMYVMTSIDSVDAEAFIHKLRTGEDLSARSPILALRKRLLANKTSLRRMEQTHYCALVIKAWNDFRDGIERTTISWRPGGATPEAYPIAH